MRLTDPTSASGVDALGMAVTRHGQDDVVLQKGLDNQAGETVTAEGRAFPIADIGFALADEEGAVLVASPAQRDRQALGRRSRCRCRAASNHR